MMKDSARDTRDHIDKVDANLMAVISDLRIRRWTHDESKLEEPELSGYAGLSDALKGLTYGTPEHREAFAPFKGIIQHHYEANDHHPEHFANGVNDMSLMQIIEMMCDWKAANDRGDGGDFANSIAVSVKRFGIDAQLAGILTNTARALGWLE